MNCLRVSAVVLILVSREWQHFCYEPGVRELSNHFYTLRLNVIILNLFTFSFEILAYVLRSYFREPPLL